MRGHAYRTGGCATVVEAPFGAARGTLVVKSALLQLFLQMFPPVSEDALTPALLRTGK